MNPGKSSPPAGENEEIPALIEMLHRHDFTSGRNGASRIFGVKYDLLSQTDKHPPYTSAESQDPIEDKL
jgi:hypothetical protein